MSRLRPRIRQKLDGLVARVEQLLAQSADPAVLAQGERLAKLQREIGSTTPLVERYRGFVRLEHDIEEHRALVTGGDRELAELARSELPALEARADREVDELVDALLADTGDDRRDCIIEIRAGTGGEEAALFARDLCTIYQRFASRQGWTFEPIHSTPTETGGFKDITFALRGTSVFHAMQFESGGHRVQRVPETEAKGRVHTSAATVAVLPEVEEVEVHIDPQDLRVDTFRASGAGGQHVNKTESAVRITHIPTGTVVACQEERSQLKNKQRAMSLLRARIHEATKRAADAARAAERREQVGSGDRSDRIRTYNFPQDRLTDHRLNRNFALSQILEGKLEPVVEGLLADQRQRRIEEL
ncbi:MAG: peptide chain release factor 1 [Planctomycetes bacterium]|nr:peptide chain release factor 1 [Planctomycetota bacterium]